MTVKRNIKSKPATIVVVTKDKQFMDSLRNNFDENYHFIHSQPVDNLVKKACEIEPDLILKDISRYKNVSLQVFNSLKSDYRTHHIPIIIVTEKEKPNNLEEYFEAGVSDNIAKHFNPTEIRLIINTHLELKQKIDENKEMHFVKTKFFSIMTNDIKDSLLGVKGIAGFLLNDLESESEKTNEVVKMARILYEDSKNLYKFLENLIEWASIETNKKEFKPELINLQEIIHELIDHFNNDIEQKNITLKTDLNKNIEFITDRNGLKTILLHIISNAIKYSNKDGNISIRAESRSKSSNTRIEIEDNGIGMDDDVVKHIFRLDTPHPKTIGTFGEKGIGLGLIICRSILDKLFGKINIESRKHRGTKVTLMIPDLKK